LRNRPSFATLRGFTHHRLDEAMRSQGSRWEKIAEELLSPLEPGEIDVWPEDPLDILARVIFFHAMRLFSKSFYDPLGYEEEKKRAPTECFLLGERSGRSRAG
jgi:hypothetical protein